MWKAYDGDRRSLAAIKVLHGQYAADRSRRDRFFRGARLMARLHHPNVARVIDEKCDDGGFFFFVMEYVGGGDFRHAVLDGGLSVREKLRIVLEVGEALTVAHEQGMVHRDVKPSNILLDFDGCPKLTDFDLVRAADTTGGTRTSMLGTFLYASPEAMIDAKTAGVPADVYGLGMTAVFALHGADLSAGVLWELPELIATLDVTEPCRNVLSKALARKVEGRWATVVELCVALRESLTEEARSTEPSGVRLAQPMTSTGEERLHEKDGSGLVPVPGGEYLLGEGDKKHRVVLSPFWIGKFPVTNEQYGRFLEAGPSRRKPGYWDDEKFNDPRQPVVGVSWLEALAYCRWAELDLPSEAEWEAAARGTDACPYPWGQEEPSDKLANFGRNVGRPTPVGAYPEGRGPYGTLDQAGNVWEWCWDEFKEDAYGGPDGQRDPLVRGDETDEAALRVLRGGSWAYPSGDLRAAVRDGSRAGNRRRNDGFRVLCRFGPENGS